MQAQALELITRLATQSTSPLNTMLRNVTTTHMATGQESLLCPGLVTRDIGESWIIPNGESIYTTTYCMACSKQYGLLGVLHKHVGNCNCDSYTVVNKVDNGIFNISFWSEDLTSMFSTTKVSDVFSVYMSSGVKFCILIHGKIKQDQCFRYTVKSVTGDVEKTLYQETIYSFNTIIPSKDGKNVTYSYFNSDMLGLELLSNIVTEQCKLIFLIDIYECQLKDLSSLKNQYLGSFNLSNTDDITNISTPTELSQLIIDNYEDKPMHLQSYKELIKFTQNPLIIKVDLVNSSSKTNMSQKVLNTMLKSVLINNSKDRAMLINSCKTLTAQLETYSHELTVLKQGIEHCNAQSLAIKNILAITPE